MSTGDADLSGQFPPRPSSRAALPPPRSFPCPTWHSRIPSPPSPFQTTPGDRRSHPGKQDRAARAPRPACVSGSSQVGGEPSSPRTHGLAVMRIPGRRKGLWHVFNELLFHRSSSRRAGPGRALGVAHQGGLWAGLHGSTHSPFRTPACADTTGYSHPILLHITAHSPPEMRSWTVAPCTRPAPQTGTSPRSKEQRDVLVHRNTYPVQVWPRAGRSHVLTAARSANMMTQLKAGRGWKGWYRRRSVAWL